jgi:glycolate oxidase
MDALSVEIIESFHPSGLVVPPGAMLVGQTVGLDAEAKAGIITGICAAHGASDTEISESDALLEARRLSNPALNARGLKISCDVGVPVAALAEMFHGVAGISARHGLRVSTVAHAGDGNLHSTVESPDDPDGIRAADAVIDDITRLALSLGGTISGEHGIGSVKRHELPWQLDATALAVQHAIKNALDPHGILTPDRAI